MSPAWNRSPARRKTDYTCLNALTPAAPDHLTLPAHPSAECEDRSGSCAGWAADNQCTANWSYMSVFCRRACGLCGDAAVTGCGDTAAQCAEWAKAGECAANPDYMTVHCRKACGLC